MVLVLYSAKRDTWKLADFGLTSEGTSRRQVDTQNSNGSPSYRAPELLSEPSYFVNKTDIFAFGCIFHELITARKAFANDDAVLAYHRKAQRISIPTDQYVSQALSKSDTDNDIMSVLHPMLEIVCNRRPSAINLVAVFKDLHDRSDPSSLGKQPFYGVSSDLWFIQHPWVGFGCMRVRHKSFVVPKLRTLFSPRTTM
jgi:serine/threonine protein kinase